MKKKQETIGIAIALDRLSEMGRPMSQQRFKQLIAAGRVPGAHKVYNSLMRRDEWMFPRDFKIVDGAPTGNKSGKPRRKKK